MTGPTHSRPKAGAPVAGGPDHAELSARLRDLFQLNAVTEVAAAVVQWRQESDGRLTLAEHLRRVLPDRCRAISEIRIRILKRHRTRCTFEIEWPGQRPGRVVIGKVYEADRADVYYAMAAIRRAGFGPNDPFSIPEPLAYVPEWRLLLMEKVTGMRAKDILLTGSAAERVEIAERCADWLARFQTAVPLLADPNSVTDLLTSVEEWSRFFRALGGGLGDKVKRLQRGLEAAADALHPTEACAGHGHYTCGQVLITQRYAITHDVASGRVSTGQEAPTGDRVVTFDWDGYDVADPCRDLACFVVDLERLAWKTPESRTALEHATAIFLQTYFARRPEIGSNLPFYAAALCLRLATRDFGKHSAEHSAAMLDEGLRILNEGLSSWSISSLSPEKTP